MRNMPIHALFEVRIVRQPMRCMPLPVHPAPRQGSTFGTLSNRRCVALDRLVRILLLRKECWSARDRRIGG
jgi:hypothetical protein